MTDSRKITVLVCIALVLVVLYLGLGLNARNWDYALPGESEDSRNHSHQWSVPLRLSCFKQ